MSLTKAREIGLANAAASFDQACDFDNIDHAIASYCDNACDTLVEEGLANDECHAEMMRAFDNCVIALRNNN